MIGSNLRGFTGSPRGFSSESVKLGGKRGMGLEIEIQGN